uniref:Granulins domain-containing protein n=1 Tax=Lepeophtheirus salmonis TaxID=72036 RepID=A0A0K2TDV2_LEPSM
MKYSICLSLAVLFLVTLYSAPAEGIVRCDSTGHFVCPDHSTCCKTSTGYGCCPLFHGVCCRDGLHCCPSGMRCDLYSNRCLRGLEPFVVTPTN